MINTTLGHYQITTQLGAGGMGEVYRARDTKLERDVAIKVLPRSFADEHDRLGRFEQEARTLASLNHPGIMVIYDSGMHEGAPYLISELLEGQTLRDVLKNGPLPPRKAAEYAVQVAHALAAAHNKGIIHRDLKPENLFITPDDRVKVLDFGLAKLRSLAAKTDVPSSARPTIMHATEPGMVLGTPGYMAPEQARGGEAEARSDIFALGAILYEMLCGQRAFGGESSVEAMHAILTSEPQDLFEQVERLPPALERVVRRCLEKRPEQRFQTAADLAFALENSISSGGSSIARQAVEAPRRLSLRRLIPLATALVGFVVGAFIVWKTPRDVATRTGPAPALRKMGINLPAASRISTSGVNGIAGMQLSPDGKKIVYVNADGLWLYWLDRVAAPVFLAKTSDPVNINRVLVQPFWSPRSDEVAYFDARQLYRVALNGVRPQVIATVTDPNSTDLPYSAAGGVWLEDDRILYTTGMTGLLEVPAHGGAPTVALAPEPTELDFHDASALPGGHGAVFVIHRVEPRHFDTIAVWAPPGPRKAVYQISGASISDPVYVASGHILFQRMDNVGGLWALPFSLETLERTGEPFHVADQASFPSAAVDGALIYQPAVAQSVIQRQLVWVDRAGRIVDTVGAPMASLNGPQLSPNRQRVAAISMNAPQEDDIWVLDIAHGNPVPLNRTSEAEINPFWYPDGSRVLFSKTGPGGQGAMAVYSRPVDGFGADEQIAPGWLREFSRSGRYMLVRVSRQAIAGADAPVGNVWTWAELAGNETKLQMLPTGLDPQDVALAPDDTLLAYSSRETGRDEVFVINFPAFTGRTRISRDGGVRMQWNADGSELFYLTPDRQQLWSAKVKRDGALQVGEVSKVCDLPEPTYNSPAVAGTTLFQVSADGQRFLMLQSIKPKSDQAAQQSPTLLLVENWFEEFREKK